MSVLDIDVDLNDVDEEKLENSSSTVPDGYYHASVNEVSEDTSKTSPAVVFEFLIWDGTVKGQKNRRVFERLYITVKTKDRQALFLKRLGMATSDNFKAKDRISGKSWSETKGSQVIIEVVTEEYEKKDGSKGKSSKLTFNGIYAVDDPRVAEVPKNKAALDLIGKGHLATAGTSHSSKLPQQPAKHEINVDDL